ncbi:hypothetical protein EMCRGX_G005388 [Ephydatia muelleri]
MSDGKRKTWDPVEVDKFKSALLQFGPLSNVAIAKAISTRTCKHVGVFKRSFLLKNPTWLVDNTPPVPQSPKPPPYSTAVNSNSNLNLNLISAATSSSPAHHSNVYPSSPPRTVSMSPSSPALQFNVFSPSPSYSVSPLPPSESFQCALCEYTNEKLRSTSLPFRHTHGAAIPPTVVVGSNAKACPFCPRTFPSAHSCSTHIRGMHMAQTSAQRAKEATEKEIQQGASTARMKWTAREIEQFKTALAQYGPTSNVKLAAAIETRTRDQVNAYKNRFLKANPTWVTEHYRPAAPADQPARPVPTRSSRPSTGSPEEHIQRDPSGTQRSRTAGTRAPMATSRQRRGPLSLSPSPSPSTNTVQQLAPWPPPHLKLQALPPCNNATPGGGGGNGPPQSGRRNPFSAITTEETISRIRRLDDHLQALRTTAPDTPGPDVPSFTPPPVELVSPGREMGTQPPMLANTPDTQGEGTPSPPPAPLLKETVLRLQSAEEALNKLRNSAVERWEPEPSNFPSLAQENQRRRSCHPGVRHSQHPSVGPRRGDVVPNTPCVLNHPTNLAPHRGRRRRSLLHVPPFIPARLQTDALARESAPPTPPSSPRAGDPEGCVADQPPSLVPPRNGRLSIDPDNLDESLRLPFQHDIRPYSGRLLGQFEWVAFEETLNRCGLNEGGGNSKARSHDETIEHQGGHDERLSRHPSNGNTGPTPVPA